MKHTPATWRASIAGPTDEIHIYNRENGNILAVVDDTVGTVAARGNAYLLAASPDMLALLRTMKTALGEFGAGQMDADVFTSISMFHLQMTKVIARAEGIIE